jgi:hypothetical protein
MIPSPRNGQPRLPVASFQAVQTGFILPDPDQRMRLGSPDIIIQALPALVFVPGGPKDLFMTRKDAARQESLRPEKVMPCRQRRPRED